MTDDQESQQKKTWYRYFLLTLFFSIIGYMIASKGSNFSDRITNGFFLGCVPWGWWYLSKTGLLNFINSIPLIGWALYLFLKLALSAIIGIFIIIYQVYQIVMYFQSNKKSV